MTSATPTLLDPFEVSGAARPRLPSAASLTGVDPPTEWFDRGALGFALADVALVEELREVPPWTPEPVDRRWRARGWTDD
jgi:hypothetical protein